MKAEVPLVPENGRLKTVAKAVTRSVKRNMVSEAVGDDI